MPLPKDEPTIESEEAEPLPAGARLEFPCDECGADMTWDPSRDALTCAYCEHVRPVPRAAGTLVERTLDLAGDAGSAARGFGIDARVNECSTCGARVTFEGGSTSELCVYCGSPSVLPQEASRNAIRPESLVPLDIGRDEVKACFERWIRGLWFRPNALKRTMRFDAAGIYVPFWTFDCRVHSEWSADAGHYDYVTETYTVTVDGRRQTRTRRVRTVRWVPAWGERDDAYDDLLVLASRGLPSDLVAELGAFDTDALVPYRPEYLAGWRAEEYQLDLEDGWQEGRARVVASQERRCAEDVPGDTHRDLRVANRIRDVHWKHVLLPVWSVQYRFRGNPYTVLVHGQSGRVVGKAPISRVKVLLAALAVLAIAGTIVVLARAS